jgi:DNA-binding transcriptional LysR family regulator
MKVMQGSKGFTGEADCISPNPADKLACGEETIAGIENMDRLTALRVFVDVAERGSLSRAADQLGMSLSMVSRHVAAVEEWLGTRLLHRTTRRISLTETGLEALGRCRNMLEMSQELESVVGSRRREASGRLRISASPSFADAQLTAALLDFQRHHPQVEVELMVGDRQVDLVEERIDLTVRITNTLDDQLVARKLAICRSVLCASPAYIEQHGSPRTPADLAVHRCITHAYGNRAEYRLRGSDGLVTVPVQGALSSNETAVLRQAALAGAGIAMLPTYYVANDLRRGALVPLLSGHEPETLGVHAVYLSRRFQPLALRLLVDWLAECFGGEPPPWDRVPAPVSRARRSPQTPRE